VGTGFSEADSLCLAKLTIFAAAAVIPAECGIRAIVSILTGNAQANTGQGCSSRLGNSGCAFRTVAQGRALGQTALRTADPILHSRVDLILYRPVTGPTCRHASLRLMSRPTLAPALYLWLRGGPVASSRGSSIEHGYRSILSMAYRALLE
jgi:hypothetical protein